MAKIPFSKLGLKTAKAEVKTITINEQEVEVKQYLPIQDKLNLVSNVINAAAAQDENYKNPIKLDVFGALEMLYAYTNLTFTDKQKEDPSKLYDILDSNHIFDIVFDEIPDEEYNFIVAGIEESSDAIYEYHNSVLGVLEAVSNDYENLNFDVEQLMKNIDNKDNLTLLKDVVTKLD